MDGAGPPHLRSSVVRSSGSFLMMKLKIFLVNEKRPRHLYHYRQTLPDGFTKENMGVMAIVKSGFAAVTGLANAGKSTLINGLMQERLLITWRKSRLPVIRFGAY